MATLQNITLTVATQSNSLIPLQGQGQALPTAAFSVFVKNRSNTSSTPDSNTSYVQNDLAWKDAESQGLYLINPFLGRADLVVLPPAPTPPIPVTLTLRTNPIAIEEIILPAVNIHFLAGTPGQTWVFNYTISFVFDDGSTFKFTPADNGITGIVLDDGNRDYAGICQELTATPPFAGPAIDSILHGVTLIIHTHGDDDDNNKDSDTVLDIHIVNRVSASISQDLVIAKNVLPNTEFAKDSVITLFFASNFIPLASDSIRLQDMVLPVVNIAITPNGNDTWKFDYQVTLAFDFEGHPNALRYSSTTSGVVLNQDARTHSGVYQGDSFPTVKPVVASLTGPAVPSYTKTIPLSLLRNKFAQIITNRQGLDPDSTAPTIRKIRIDHTAAPSGGFSASYFDVQSIEADPPFPGTVLPAGYKLPVKWTSSPSDLGQLNKPVVGYFHLSDINSNSLTAVLDSSQVTPIIITLGFETDGPNELSGDTFATTAKFTQFSIQVKLTLTLDPDRQVVDLMSWVRDLENPNNLVFTPIAGNPNNGTVSGTLLGQPVSVTAVSLQDGKNTLLERVLLVTLNTSSWADAGGTVRQAIRDKIYGDLSNPNPFGPTGRESLNSLFNTILLGGAVDGNTGANPVSNLCTVTNVVVDAANDNLLVTYAGPTATFQYDEPANWQQGIDFSQGALSNIDHIVVLTMENRSFDHMLGYLSLPQTNGGMGRTDIDGLKGGEVNFINGTIPCPSKSFLTGETVFAPDPPHSFEPVQAAINWGAMDGFAQSYANGSGLAAGPNIMKYYTAANVPVYDALARDFAIGHRWFASHPGPTFCNRFHELSGRLNINTQAFWDLSNNSIRPAFTETIFDALDKAGVSWKYFEDGYCFLRFFQNYTFNNTNIVDYNDPGLGFVNVALTGNLPSVTFIDPHFIELPPGGTCDGPPADIAQGQLLVKQVVESVISSPNWSKTMLIVTYDEHGGFFDHVPPPPAAQVAPGLPSTYGVRVPAFVISPWVPASSVFGSDATGVSGQALYFDHTSILKTIAKRFLSSNPPYLGPRYAAANDLSSVIGTPRTGVFLPFIPYVLTYGASQNRLDVQGGSAAPGTLLWQYGPNGSDAQSFSFEDAGGGYYCVRTHTGNLYVTVDVPASGSAQTYGIKQDVKYATGGAGNPDTQRWDFSFYPSPIGNHGPTVTIHSAFAPQMLLHPAGDSVASGASVVLEAVPSTGLDPLHSKYSWVISPLSAGPPDGGTVQGTPGNYVIASPSSLTFPTQHVGTQGEGQTLTVLSQLALTISAIALVDGTGAPSPDYNCFPLAGSPPPAGNVAIPEKGQLTVSVWFHPTAVGARNAQLQLTHNSPGSPLIIPLNGTGDLTPIGILTCSAGIFSFNPKSAKSHALTLTNTGNGPLTISSFALSDTTYSITNTCGVGPTAAVLQPGKTCTVNIVCHFVGAGGSTTLSINHDGAGSPAQIDLESPGKAGPPV